MHLPKTLRDWEQHLRALGARLERHSCGHDQWRLPNGRMFTVSKGALDGDPRKARNMWAGLRRRLNLQPGEASR